MNDSELMDIMSYVKMFNNPVNDWTTGGLTSIADSSVSTYAGSNTTVASNINVNIKSHFSTEDFLDQHIMNRVTLDHKVQEQELMKLKEVAPDYANEIKEELSKNAARDIVKKMTFTKRHDKDMDIHHFIGRVWVFTEDELKNLINEARNA